MPQLNASESIVNDDGTMKPVFQKQMNRYEAQYPIVGDGDPNGVVEGDYLQLYINTSGVAGSIEWRKMLPEFGGDKTLGWVAI